MERGRHLSLPPLLRSGRHRDFLGSLRPTRRTITFRPTSSANASGTVSSLPPRPRNRGGSSQSAIRSTAPIPTRNKRFSARRAMRCKPAASPRVSRSAVLSTCRDRATTDSRRSDRGGSPRTAKCQPNRARPSAPSPAITVRPESPTDEPKRGPSTTAPRLEFFWKNLEEFRSGS
jgi:hypothetical protein